ncbi:MAG: hypothetical protein ACI4B9_07920 [Eggerthellaceae bacterium]
MLNRRISRIVAMALACCALLLSLCACVGASEADKGASENRQCLSLLSSRVGDLQDVMVEFEAAASEQNVVAMKTQLGNAQAILDQIREQDATEALADVKEAYVAALDELDQAMSAYVDVYEKVQNGEMTAADAQTEIEGIQQSYNDAVDKLEKADESVKKLAG